MNPHSGEDGEIFVDRRRVPTDVRSVIDNELHEWNRRRDDSLKLKLDALISYHSLSLTTRADALNTAITRIQGDTSACSARCEKQVSEFYELINRLRHDHIREFEKLKVHEIVAEKEFGKVQTAIKELSIRIDNLKKDTEDNHGKLKDRFILLENWKSMDWKQTLIWSACALAAVVQVLYWIHQKLYHTVI